MLAVQCYRQSSNPPENFVEHGDLHGRQVRNGARFASDAQSADSLSYRERNDHILLDRRAFFKDFCGSVLAHPLDLGHQTHLVLRSMLVVPEAMICDAWWSAL